VSSGEEGGESSGDFHSHCLLVEAFYNLSLTLTVQQQVLFNAWIQEIENSILANFSLSDDQKVVLISLSLKAFFSVNIDIYNELSFADIAGWGSVIDFLYVSIDIQLEITLSIVTLDNSNNCGLSEALQNASSSLSSNDQNSISSLIVEIQSILEDSSQSYELQLSAIWQLFQVFFSEHASLESFVLSINIEGYGSVQSFLDVCQTYERITTISTILSGNSTSDCPLLAALEAASSNSSFTLSQQAEILQLEQKLELFFSLNISISARLEYISQTCYQMFLLEPFMISIIEQISVGSWGSIYDIIFCSGICTNYGCGDISGHQQASTPAAVSTASSFVPANCQTIGQLITVDITTNTTVLTTSITNYYNNFTASQKLGFNSCFNKVRNAIWNNNAFPTQSSKFTELHTDFLQYNNNSATNQQLVFSIPISGWGGTVGQFVSCCGSSS